MSRRVPVARAVRLAAIVLIAGTGAVACGDAARAAETSPSGTDAASDDEALSFGFVDSPPGRRYPVAEVRLHVDCDGPTGADVSPVVLFEPGLGGSSLEWGPVRDRLEGRVTSCTYDRAGYGWSDPSAARRDALQLARELDDLLVAAHIDAPLVVVAHSFGGFVARLLADRHPEAVAGLVLVDTSHEEQFERLEANGERIMVPRGRQFVLSSNDAPENLPPAIRRRVQAFNRMRKTYSATYGEMASFRDSAVEVAEARTLHGDSLGMPVTVIARGARLYPEDDRGRAKNDGWDELQHDLAALGEPGRFVVATGAGHHVHVDDPDIVAREVLALVDAVRGRMSAPVASPPDR